MRTKKKWHLSSVRWLASERLLKRVRLAITLTTVLCVVSCKSPKQLTIREDSNHASSSIERVGIDEVIVRDTVRVEAVGDTIVIERIKWRERVVRDTLRVRDTVVSVETEMVETVKTERVTDWSGWVISAVLFVALFFLIKHGLKRD